jgi:hypothetical protein
MSFGAMAAWQALLLVAVAGAGAAWLFYLKVRPPRVNVPSLTLWRRVLDHERELSWWERVRRAVSLAATVLVAAALALAVTRPGPRLGSSSSRGRLLIVIDSSWSMLAEMSGGETRWDRAVAQARALAASAAGDEVAIATTADGVVEGPTSDAALIEHALDRLHPSGGEAAAWPRVAGQTVVHFLTDGALARPLDASVVLHPVYEPAPNVAITAFGVRAPAGGAGDGEIYLEVANYAPARQAVRIAVTRGTASLVDQSHDVNPGEILRQTMPVGLTGDARLRARVSAGENALAIDDEAVAWFAAAEPIDVTVVSDNPALALLLSRAAGVRTSIVSPAAYRPGREDAVVFDRWLPEAAPSRPALCIAPPAASWLGEPGAEEKEPRWLRSAPHPVLSGVDPLTLDIKRTRAYQGADLVPLASSVAGTPLVQAVDAPDRRIVVMTFSINDSNLAFAPAFPVLIGNTLEWLARPVIDAPRRPGPVLLPASTARVTAPDGRNVRLLRTGGGTAAKLDAPGLYLVETAGSRGVVTVNVGDREASNLTRTSLPTTARTDASAERSGRPWWVAAGLLAFVLIGVEWWTWQRRITV